MVCASANKMEIKTAIGLISYAIMFINLYKVMKEEKTLNAIPLIISNFILAFVGTRILFF